MQEGLEATCANALSDAGVETLEELQSLSIKELKSDLNLKHMHVKRLADCGTDKSGTRSSASGSSSGGEKGQGASGRHRGSSRAKYGHLSQAEGQTIVERFLALKEVEWLLQLVRILVFRMRTDARP